MNSVVALDRPSEKFFILPRSYQDAVHALSVCVSTDEVKSIQDKATAIKMYANQIRDKEMMKMAMRIQSRAKRRLGELLLAEGNHMVNGRNIGLTNTAIKQCVRLSRVPEIKFEIMVEHDPPASIVDIAKHGYIKTPAERAANNPFHEVLEREKQNARELHYLTKEAKAEVWGLTSDQIDEFIAGVERAIDIKTGRIKIGRPIPFERWGKP